MINIRLNSGEVVSISYTRYALSESQVLNKLYMIDRDTQQIKAESDVRALLRLVQELNTSLSQFRAGERVYFYDGQVETWTLGSICE